MVGLLVPEMGVATSCVLPTGWGQPTQWRVEGSGSQAGEESDNFLFTFFTARSLKAFEVLSHTPSGMPAILLLRFLQWLRGKAFTYNSGDQGSIPGLGRCPGEENGNPLQYPCLENPTDRGP